MTTPDKNNGAPGARGGSDAKARRKFSWGGLFKKLCLLGISVVFALVLCEVVLKLAGFGKLVIYEPHDALYWVPLPDQEKVTKIGGKPVHINARRTRGEPFEVPKKDGVFRILSLGDSRAFGWGLTEAECYNGLLVEGLRESLRQEGIDGDVEVINAGVNAWSYDQMKVFLRDYGVAFEPDLVLLGMANVWVKFTEDNSEEFKTAFKRRVWLKNLLRRSALYHFVVETQLKEFYERYRKHAIPKVSREDEKLFAERKENATAHLVATIEEIAAISEANGAEFALLFIPRETKIVEEGADHEDDIRTVQRTVAVRTDKPLIDVSEEFAAADAGLYLEADPVHPNAAGSVLVAKVLVPALLPAVRDGLERAGGTEETALVGEDAAN